MVTQKCVCVYVLFPYVFKRKGRELVAEILRQEEIIVVLPLLGLSPLAHIKYTRRFAHSHANGDSSAQKIRARSLIFPSSLLPPNI